MNFTADTPPGMSIARTAAGQLEIEGVRIDHSTGCNVLMLSVIGSRKGDRITLAQIGAQAMDELSEAWLKHRGRI